MTLAFLRISVSESAFNSFLELCFAVNDVSSTMSSDFEVEGTFGKTFSSTNSFGFGATFLDRNFSIRAPYHSIPFR